MNKMINPNLLFPEELLVEIFRHLPIESVYKLMCVCKVWFSLLTEVSKTLCASHYAFYDGPLAVASTNLLSSNFADDGLSFKLIHSKLRKFYDEICLLGSSNGLVLFLVEVFTSGTYNYFVYNPLTKTISYAISNLNGDNHARFLHGFICQTNSSSTTSSFTSASSGCSFMVVRIQEFKNTSQHYDENSPTEFKIQVFSSDLGEWCMYEVSSPPEVNCDFSNHDNLSTFCSENIIITNRRVLYWFEGIRRNRIISYDLSKNAEKDVEQRQCKLIDLPNGRDEIDYKYQSLGESGGLICYSQLQRKSMELRIWVNNQTSDTSSWELVHKIGLHNMLVRDNYLCVDNSIRPLAFHPVDRHVLLLAYSNACILALNVQTSRFEVLKRHTAEEDAYPCFRSHLPLVLTPRPTTIPRFPQKLPSLKRKANSGSYFHILY